MSGANIIVARGWRFAAILALGLIAVVLVSRFQAPDDIDFISYWAAAKLTLAGDPALAYDVAVHRAVEETVVTVDGKMPFPYPPPALFLLWPFGLLPFVWATVAWIVVGLLLYGWTVRKTLPGMLPVALAFPPLLISGIIGQNGWITASLFLGGMALLPCRPFVAGMLFGCLAMKPQLAVLVPLALLAGREWRALAGSVAGFAGLCLASLAMFGIAAWQGFFDLLPLYGSAASTGTVGWSKIASLYASLRMIGIPEAIAMTIHAVVAVAAIALVWRIWRDPALTLARAAILAAATMLISPYLYMYDHLMLIAAVAWALHQGVRQRWIAALFLISLCGLVQMVMSAPPVNVMPVVPLTLLAVVVWKSEVWGRPFGAPRPQRREAQVHQLG
jgi:Glycosyltransferase family 87